MKRLYFVLVLVLCSCKHYVYRPTTIKPTFFANKGDCEFSVNGFMMAELHGAYAVTNHWAISGTLGGIGLNRDTINTKDSTNKILIKREIDKKKVKDNEIAIGYFTPLGGGNSFEIFGGFAMAKRQFTRTITDFNNPANNFTSTATDNRYNRLFIQPAFGRNGKYVDFGIANRFSLIGYENPAKRDFISETSVMFRVGYKNVKFMGQAGFTLYNINGYYGYFPFTAGFGIYLMFNQAIKSDGFN